MTEPSHYSYGPICKQSSCSLPRLEPAVCSCWDCGHPSPAYLSLSSRFASCFMQPRMDGARFCWERWAPRLQLSDLALHQSMRGSLAENAWTYASRSFQAVKLRRGLLRADLPRSG